MNADERWFQGHLLEIDEAECWELLRAPEVGRLAFDDEDGPTIVPLTYVSGEGSLLFRVSPYSQVARHVPGARASFEVDDFDYFTRSGWSVIVRGSVQIVESDELPPLEDRPTPWPEGQRTLYLRLTPETVTGRRLLEA